MPNAVTDRLNETAAPARDLVSELEAWFAASKNRTAEEVAAARKMIISRQPRPLPPGKMLEDVFVGALPDDKSDEEIVAALAELE